jgi:hypothetical protein
VLAELAALEVLGALEVSEELAALEVLGEREVLAVSGELAELEAMDGSTILPIAVGLLTVIAQRLTALAARLVATRWLTVRPARGIRSGVRAATWAAATAGMRATAEALGEREVLEIAAELAGPAEPEE